MSYRDYSAPGAYKYHTYGNYGFAATPWSVKEVTVPRTTRAAGRFEIKHCYSLTNDMAELRRLGAAKGIVDASVTDIGSTASGKPLLALKVGNGSSHKVLFTGCHHAREWISVEIPYLVAEYLIREYEDNPTTPKGKRIKHLLTNREIWFVPMVNPDGNNHTWNHDRNWRPNRRPHRLSAGSMSAPELGGGSRTVSWRAGTYRGVDVNRNYATSTWGQETFDGGWAKTSRDPSDSGANSIWCGPGASSERETKAVDDLIVANGFRSAITYHSFSELLLYPDAAETGATGAFTRWVGGGMRDLIAAAGHAYTFQPGGALYPTTGDAMDFAWEKAVGRPSYTPELRPADSAGGTYFSFLPESEIAPTFVENLPAALALINCAGHDAVDDEHAVTVSTAKPATKVQVVRNCWKVFEGWTP